MCKRSDVSFIPGPATDSKCVPLEAQQAWVGRGTTLDVPVPDCKGGQFLSIDFEICSGTDIDFDVMLETEEGGMRRLYGPARRARRVTTCIEIPADGTCHVMFDNFGSWFTARLVSYSIEVTDTRTHIHSTSTLRYGAGVFTAKREEAPAEPAAQMGVRGAAMTELGLAAGAMEEVSVKATAGSRLCISFEVVRGGDVDFGVMFEPRDSSERPIRLYGPTRRTAELHTSFVVPATGTCHLGFDASGGWWRSKQVRYAVECRADDQA